MPSVTTTASDFVAAVSLGENESDYNGGEAFEIAADWGFLQIELPAVKRAVTGGTVTIYCASTGGGTVTWDVHAGKVAQAWNGTSNDVVMGTVATQLGAAYQTGKTLTNVNDGDTYDISDAIVAAYGGDTTPALTIGLQWKTDKGGDGDTDLGDTENNECWIGVESSNYRTIHKNDATYFARVTVNYKSGGGKSALQRGMLL